MMWNDAPGDELSVMAQIPVESSIEEFLASSDPIEDFMSVAVPTTAEDEEGDDNRRTSRTRKKPKWLDDNAFVDDPTKILSEQVKVVEEDVKEESQKDDEDNEGDGGEYCICRKPDTGTPMILCDGCGEWFHLKCLKIKQKDIKHVQHWVCPTCKEIADGLFSDPVTLIKSKPERKIKSHSSQSKKKEVKSTTPMQNPIKTASTSYKAAKICGLASCGKPASKDSDFCCFAHESEHANDLFSSMLGEAKPSTSSTTSITPPRRPSSSPSNKRRESKPKKSKPDRRLSAGDQMMKKTVEKTFKSILSLRRSEAAAIDMDHLCNSIENALFVLHNGIINSDYKLQFKRLASNLRKNVKLMSQLIDGSVRPEIFVKMSDDELGGAEMQKAKQKAQEELVKLVEVAPATIKLVLNDKDNDRVVELDEENAKRKAKELAALNEAKAKDDEIPSDANMKLDNEQAVETPEQEDFSNDNTDDEISVAGDAKQQRTRYVMEPMSGPAPAIIKNNAETTNDDPGEIDATESTPAMTPYWDRRDSIVTSPTAAWTGNIKNAGHTKIQVEGTYLLGLDGTSKTLSGIIPESLEICGRIKPQEVWDYVLKLKVSTSKDVVVCRLGTTKDDDEPGYISLFAYFNSRKRCGVLGSKEKSSVRDMYLVPVSSKSGIPTAATDNYLTGPSPTTSVKKDELLIVVVRPSETRRKRPIDAIGNSNKTNEDSKRMKSTKTDSDPYDPITDASFNSVDEPYDPTADEPYDPTADEPYDPTADSPYDPTTSDPYEPTVADTHQSANVEPKPTVTAAGLDFGAIQNMLRSMNSEASNENAPDTPPPPPTPPNQSGASNYVPKHVGNAQPTINPELKRWPRQPPQSQVQSWQQPGVQGQNLYIPPTYGEAHHRPGEIIHHRPPGGYHQGYQSQSHINQSGQVPNYQQNRQNHQRPQNQQNQKNRRQTGNYNAWQNRGGSNYRY